MSHLPGPQSFDIRVVAVPLLLLHFAMTTGELPLDDRLQPVMVLFEKRGEFKWLAVPSYWRQHLGLACNAAFVGEEHQFSDCARLHWPLQAEQAAGYGNNL